MNDYNAPSKSAPVKSLLAGWDPTNHTRMDPLQLVSTYEPKGKNTFLSQYEIATVVVTQ